MPAPSEPTGVGEREARAGDFWHCNGCGNEIAHDGHLRLPCPRCEFPMLFCRPASPSPDEQRDPRLEAALREIVEHRFGEWPRGQERRGRAEAINTLRNIARAALSDNPTSAAERTPQPAEREIMVTPEAYRAQAERLAECEAALDAERGRSSDEPAPAVDPETERYRKLWQNAQRAIDEVWEVIPFASEAPGGLREVVHQIIDKTGWPTPSVDPEDVRKLNGLLDRVEQTGGAPAGVAAGRRVLDALAPTSKAEER